MESYDAVILAGGRGSRLGGVDKPALEVGDRTLLERVLAAVTGAGRVVVAGPAAPPPAIVVREEPPGAGPVAALAAALPEVTAPVVLVLAADLPFLTERHCARLRSALRGDAAVAVDTGGHDQYLLAAWRTPALRRRLDGLPGYGGLPVRRLYQGADLDRVALEAAGTRPPPWFDCDTAEDLRTARENA
ncbi:MAG: molybdenum cofactor guanylyltransferase [Mycobacteriales bacterium]